MSALPSNREKEFKQAIKNAMPKSTFDRTNKVRIAIDSNNNEYFIELNSEDDLSFIVTHPDGIRCSVWKKHFRTKWVLNSYEIKTLAKPS